MTSKTTERPDIVEDEHLEYLDELQESGVTNMMGGASYLTSEFGLDKYKAKDVLFYWMDSYDERHPQ